MSLFSISNLFCILLIVISIGAIYMYINLKISEQNHKMTSMLGLVSTLAQEVNSIRAKASFAEEDDYEEEKQEIDTNIKMFNIDERINVSEDEESESGSESDSESDSEPDSDSDSESDSESDSNNNDDNDCTFKTLLLEEVAHDELEEEEDSLDSAIETLELSNLDKTDNVNVLLQTLVENQNTIDLSTDISTNLDEFIDSFDHSKTFHLNDDIQLVSHDSELTDFKKLSLQKLRDIVVEKGLVIDSSKLKKQELLKLLGSTSE